MSYEYEYGRVADFSPPCMSATAMQIFNLGYEKLPHISHVRKQKQLLN